MRAMDPYEAARRVAAQIEAILAIHGENLLAMRRACDVVRQEHLLMRSAVKFARGEPA